MIICLKHFFLIVCYEIRNGSIRSAQGPTSRKSTSLHFKINIVFLKMISFEKLHNIQVFINMVSCGKLHNIQVFINMVSCGKLHNIQVFINMVSCGKLHSIQVFINMVSCGKLHNIQVFINMFPVENCAAVRAGFCPKCKWKQYVSLLGT